MNQSQIDRKISPKTVSPKSVVMGQGIITPAVREHLAKTQRLARTAAKPQQVR